VLSNERFTLDPKISFSRLSGGFSRPQLLRVHDVMKAMRRSLPSPLWLERAPQTGFSRDCYQHDKSFNFLKDTLSVQAQRPRNLRIYTAAALYLAI
jgi:hypothetical protein